MAGLKNKIAKLEDVSEIYRGFYEENEGTFVLKDEFKDLSEAVFESETRGLKTGLEKERADRKKLETDLARFKEIGDIDKAKEALSKIQEIEEANARRTGDWEKQKTQMQEKHAEEMKKLRDTLSEREKSIDKMARQNAAIAALSSEKGRLKVLLPHILAHTKIKGYSGDGEPIVVVVDENGTERVGDGQGALMSISQLVKEMKSDPEFAPNFEGSGTSGGGANGGQSTAKAGGSGVKTVKSTDQAALNANIEDIAKGKVQVID